MVQLNEIKRIISDESEYEAQYAFGNEIFNDFNYNVGRKIHVIKSSIKVTYPILSIIIICMIGVVLPYWNYGIS